MKEIVFETEKTFDEIEKDFANTDYFSGIMDGLKEALAYERGESNHATFARKRNLPGDVVPSV